jgi:hypothetical protein
MFQASLHASQSAKGNALKMMRILFLSIKALEIDSVPQESSMQLKRALVSATPLPPMLFLQGSPGLI